jgi:hypothetical protein
MSISTKKSWLPDAFANYSANAPAKSVETPNSDAATTAGSVRQLGLGGADSGSTKSAFALPELGTMMTEQVGLTHDRQQQETQNLADSVTLSTQAAEKSKGVLDTSYTASEQIREQQLAVLGGTDEMIRRANIAIALSDSKNPIDHLHLWMLQQSDPTYTAEGNTARLNYLHSASAMLGEKGVIQQQGFSEQLQQIDQNLKLSEMGSDNELKILSLREAQGAERIKMAQDIEAGRLGKLQNQNSMQQATLANMDAPMIAAAQAQAASSPDGTANVNGVQLSTAQIADWDQKLKDRAYLMDARDSQYSDLILSKMTMPQVQAAKLEATNSQDGAAVIQGRPISLARIQDRESALLNQSTSSASQQLALQAQTQNMFDETNKRILATMNVPMLNALRAKGGIDDSGVKFNTDDIAREIALQTAQQTTDMANQASIASFGDPMATILDTQKSLDAVGQQATQLDANSDLGKYVLKSQHLLKMVASNIAAQDPANPNPAQQAMNATIIGNMQAQLNGEIEKEALKQAGGDKDLAQIYSYKLRGQLVPEGTVRDILTSRITAPTPKSTAQFLSPKDNGIFTQAYWAKLNELQSQGAMSVAPPDKAAMKQQAADFAIDQVKSMQANGLTDQIMAFQIKNGTDNPLKGVMNETQFLDLVHQTDSTGLQSYIQQNNIPAEQAQKMMNGDIPSQAVSEIESVRASHLYLELEKAKPGLGKDYLTWWGGQGRSDMVAKFIASQQAAAATPQANAALSLLAPDMPGAMANYGNTLASGERTLYASELAKQHADFITFGGNATNKQIFLLDTDKNLSDTDKQQSMRLLINPLIDEARANQMSPEQTNVFIESSLKQMTPDDPAAKKLLNKVLAGRDHSIGIMESFMKLSSMHNLNTGNVMVDSVANASVIPALKAWGVYGNPVDRATNGVEWYNDMVGKSGP